MAARPRDTPSPKQIKDALRQASDGDLFYEVCRRGMISSPEIKRREKWGEAKKSLEDQKDSAARHREYVQELFVLLHQKRIEKIEEKCIWRAHTVPEFAALGVMMTKTIFDHLVDARRAELDQGSCNIESLLEDFMSDSGRSFAESLVSGDIRIRSTLWASLIYTTVHYAARSFSDIVDEDAVEADQDNRSPEEPGFIN